MLHPENRILKTENRSSNPSHPLDVRPEGEPEIAPQLEELGLEGHPVRPVDVECLAGEVLPGDLPRLARARVVPGQVPRPPSSAVRAAGAIVPHHEEPVLA